MIIRYLKSITWSLSIILVSTIIITIFNYFNILSGTILKIFEIIIPIIAIFIGSYLIGKSSVKKGYIEGLKYGGIWILILLLCNLITKNTALGDFIYFLILLLASVGASMIGINRKAS